MKQKIQVWRMMRTGPKGSTPWFTVLWQGETFQEAWRFIESRGRDLHNGRCWIQVEDRTW